MINYLIKRFIKDYEQFDNTVVRKNYGILSSSIGIVCNIFLCIAKFVIGTMANSISIISDGFNNLSDCASCIFTIFGYKMAAKPADKDHPFGHGRMEYLTSLVIAMIIVVVGSQLFVNSIEKIIHPEFLKFTSTAFVMLILSILVKIWIGVINHKMGKMINSSVMKATARDSINDVIATFATLVALCSSIFTTLPIDGIMGVIVSIFVLFSGFGIVKETIDQLLGKPAEPELVESIRALVDDTPCSLGMHDLMIHSYGPGNLIGSVHIEVDSNGNIMDIHDEIDELERKIFESLNVRITVHMDPVNPNDEFTTECKAMITKIIEEIDERLTFHDFRVVAGHSHTNLIFDIVLPYECKLDEQNIKQRIDDRLKNEKIVFYTVITFDKCVMC